MFRRIKQQYEWPPANPAITAQPMPVKVYEFVILNKFTFYDIEAQHNGKPFIWYHNHVRFLKAPVYTLHAEARGGPVVVTARHRKRQAGMLMAFGDTQSTQEEDYLLLDRVPYKIRTWEFAHPGTGQRYQWQYRRREDASLLTPPDWTLVDAANQGQILAVCVRDRTYPSSPVHSRLQFWVRLEDDLELLVILSLLLIQGKQRSEE